MKHQNLIHIPLKKVEFFDWLASCCEFQECSFTVGRLYCVCPVCVKGIVFLCTTCSCVLIDIHIPWNWPTRYAFRKLYLFLFRNSKCFFDWHTNKVLSPLLPKRARVRHCSPLLFKLTTQSSTERALISYACNSS